MKKQLFLLALLAFTTTSTLYSMQDATRAAYKRRAQEGVAQLAICCETLPKVPKLEFSDYFLIKNIPPVVSAWFGGALAQYFAGNTNSEKLTALLEAELPSGTAYGIPGRTFSVEVVINTVENSATLQEYMHDFLTKTAVKLSAASMNLSKQPVSEEDLDDLALLLDSFRSLLPK